MSRKKARASVTSFWWRAATSSWFRWVCYLFICMPRDQRIYSQISISCRRRFLTSALR